MNQDAIDMIKNTVDEMFQRIERYEEEKDDGHLPEDVIAHLESCMYRIKRWLPQEG